MGGILRFRRQSILGLLAGGALLLSAGCGRDAGALPLESDEPLYREGLQLGKEGRTQEALADYLKVIAKRGDLAPESHLNAGLIYLGDVKDPIAAIYHFREYLEFEPNSAQAAYVRELIDTAKRDFARTLPGDPLSSETGDPTLIGHLDRLQRENEELRAELAAMGDSSKAGPAAAAAAPVAEPAIEAPAAVPVPEAVQSPPPAPAPAPVPPPAAGRRYTVAPRDTLFGIAKRFYGVATNARVEAILRANRGVLSGARGLKPGMELKIP